MISFKTLRITVLLIILGVVAFSTWQTQRRLTDWQEPLWVYLYPIAGDESERTRRFLDGLEEAEFDSIERFIQREVARYGRPADQPVKLLLQPELNEPPPALPENPNLAQVAVWTTRLRWWASGIRRNSSALDPDIQIFVRYFDPATPNRLEQSVGLKKGRVGVVNAYAARREAGMNSVIIAHELLHTLGASDKYDLRNGQPLAPVGLADPSLTPLFPQAKAEIMAVRRAVGPRQSVPPGSLANVVIGQETAVEIGLAE